MGERVLLTRQQIRVTPTRLIVGENTYALAHLEKIRGRQLRWGTRFSLFVLGLAVATLLGGGWLAWQERLREGILTLLLGGDLVLIGCLLHAFSSPRFAVRFGFRGESSLSVVHADAQFVADLQEAVSQAAAHLSERSPLEAGYVADPTMIEKEGRAYPVHDETEYLRQGDLLVTNKRVVLGDQMCRTQLVSSVECGSVLSFGFKGRALGVAGSLLTPACLGCLAVETWWNQADDVAMTITGVLAGISLCLTVFGWVRHRRERRSRVWQLRLTPAWRDMPQLMRGPGDMDRIRDLAQAIGQAVAHSHAESGATPESAR